jgi:hypothetical protein
MSTRALYSFFEKGESTINIYVHSDGYPSGAVDYLKAMLPLAWPLPRYEASDMAAAFVAGNKSHPGNVRIYSSGFPQRVAPQDLEYMYEIRMVGGQLQIKCFEANYDDENSKWFTKLLFKGALDSFGEWALQIA